MRRETRLQILLSLLAILLYILATTTCRDNPGNCLLPEILFALLSLGGIVATLRPDLCLHRRVSLDPRRVSIFLGFKVIHGHHPLCDGFTRHEIKIKGKTLCAGCLGLVIGSLAALTLILLDFHCFIHPVIGVLLVSIGLFHPFLSDRPTLLRILLNTFLPLGFAVVLISACRAGGLPLGLLALGFSLLWMATRIELSRWEHESICRRCGACPLYIELLPHSKGSEDYVDAEEDDENRPDVPPSQPWDIGL